MEIRKHLLSLTKHHNSFNKYLNDDYILTDHCLGTEEALLKHCIVSKAAQTKQYHQSAIFKDKTHFYIYLKAKSILFFPKAKMCYFLIPEFIWLYHTNKGHLSWNNIL